MEGDGWSAARFAPFELTLERLLVDRERAASAPRWARGKVDTVELEAVPDRAAEHEARATLPRHVRGMLKRLGALREPEPGAVGVLAAMRG